MSWLLTEYVGIFTYMLYNCVDAGTDACDLNLTLDDDADDRGNEAELEVPVIPPSLQRQVVVTSDNAANILSAVNGSSMKHVQCLTHTVNLAVQAFTKVINLAPMRSVIKHFHKSPGHNAELKVME